MEYKGTFLFAFIETWLKDQYKSSKQEIEQIEMDAFMSYPCGMYHKGHSGH